MKVSMSVERNAYGYRFALAAVAMIGCVLSSRAEEIILWRSNVAHADCVIVAEEKLENQLLEASVRDLAFYLTKMSGRQVEIVTDESLVRGRVAIRVGKKAKAIFGPCGSHGEFAQGLRVVADKRRGIGLYGESPLADSYAVYTFLDDLGCRWFFPTDLGEVIPVRKALTYPACDRKLTPYTYCRTGNGYAYDADCLRRNRMGGPNVPTQHCLEHYVGKELSEHPEWQAEYADGRPMKGRLKWSNAELAERIGEVIVGRNRRKPASFWCLSPDDGARFDESADDRALDAGDFDTTFQTVSLTDRILVFYNRIVRRALRECPDLHFCALAYVQYTRPPVRETPHERLVVQIAPITYSRAHPMDIADVPDNDSLNYIVEGWGKKSKAVSYYLYGYFLAAPISTFPCFRKWAHDIKVLYAKGSCRYWQPETMSNNEFFAMAGWMGQRMAWDPSQDPWKLLREANDALYGPAAETMWAFFDSVDRLWVEAKEYSGAAWGHLNRFAPEQMSALSRLLERAEREAESDPKVLERVRLAKLSWKLTTDFVALRRDLAEGRWTGLAARSQAWWSLVSSSACKYEKARCFSHFPYSKSKSFGCDYYDSFYRKTHDAADALSTNAMLLVRHPIVRFRYRACTNGVDATVRAALPEDAAEWGETDVMRETWSSLGFHNHMGAMHYQATVDLAPAPAGKPVRVWIGATDGSADVWLNGVRLEPIGPRKGFGRPLAFEATKAVRQGVNVIDVSVVRDCVNEVGTGGLLGPVTVYAEK